MLPHYNKKERRLLKPKHPAASFCLREKIFEGLSNFSDLEERISSLDNNKLKGDVFEVFVEGFLYTQPAYCVESVWTWHNVPEEVKSSLELSIKDDYGIDGVFRTRTDQIATYQVKFKSDKKKLSWGGDKLGNFFGLTKRDNFKYIITNSYRLPDNVLKDRTDVCTITAEQFGGMCRTDFDLINDWLKGAKIVRSFKAPLSHQKDAVEAIAKEFDVSKRATAVMACGSGKSLVGLWVAEKIESKCTLVLVPSLSLLSQIFHEWMSQTKIIDVAPLCVCSDPSVTRGEETKIFSSDQDFPVSTNPDEIKKFLNSDLESKVVFSTYQSAHLIASVMAASDVFDLAIFDEAHKTAGREGKKFAFALNDEHIRISKRLFLTATPKHFRVRNSEKEEHTLSYSMNNEMDYGKTCYRLSFAEAVQKNIICPYQVIITILTKKEVDRGLLSRAKVDVGDEFVRAKQVANQLAVRKAIEKYGVKKIITFHATVKSAESFVSSGEDGVRAHIPSIQSFHVNGKQHTSERNEKVSKFKESDLALLSNARCLTEGVDVPEVDMVAFLSPKRSKIDVIQATGRAMRKDREGLKKVGYVLVPMYFEEDSNERLESAMYESDFAEVFDVLNALQQQDEVLAESLCEIREKRDEVKGFIDERFEDRVSIEGPELMLSDLKQAIMTKIVNRLTPIWYERFSELKKFFSEHGHSDVPANWSENIPLANWVRTQRSLYTLEQLSNEQIKKLGELDFVWSLNESRWETRFLEYLDFIEEFGTHSIPNEAEYASLRSWVITQRKEQRKGTLDQARFEELDNIGFIWDLAEERWNERYLDLLSLYESTGSSSVPRALEFQTLYAWSKQQRKEYKQSSLSTEKVELLNQIEFDWHPVDSNADDYWDTKYGHLKAYFETHGTSYVPARYPVIGQWSAFQRGDRRKGVLSEERIQKLDEINFIWEPRDRNWLNKFFKYKKLVGLEDSKLFAKNNEDKNLRAWAAAQRREIESYSSSGDPLLRHRAKLLRSIKPIRITTSFQGDDVFLEMLEDLALFAKKNGHTRVPTKGGDNPRLGRWFDSIRKRYKKGNLEKHEIELLEEYEFDFTPRKRKYHLSDQVFIERLSQLRDFKKENGHLNIPTRNGLGAWLSRQKTLDRKGLLERSKYEELAKLGVKLEPHVVTSSRRAVSSQGDVFVERLNELKEYKELHGHLNMSTRRGLGAWLSRQKTNHRKGILDHGKVLALEEVGVEFEHINQKVKPSKSVRRYENSYAISLEQQWQSSFLELIQFKAKFGHTSPTVTSKAYAPLARWVKTQRASYRNEALTPEHLQQLISIGFEFIAPKQAAVKSWDERFQDLVDYHEKFGHLNIPRVDKVNAPTRSWIRNQITAFRKGTLDPAREEKLRGYGVPFEKQKKTPGWNERYEELIDFKDENGHVDVPQLYGGSTGLGRWVNRQRQFFQLDKLSPEKIQKLEAVGFVWGGARGRQDRL